MDTTSNTESTTEVTVNDTTYKIDLTQFTQCTDTWIPSERVGYRLYSIEELGRVPSQGYALTKYTWQSEIAELLDIGRVSYETQLPPLETINEFFNSEDIQPLSEGQWTTLNYAYQTAVSSLLEDTLFDGVPQVYNHYVYTEGNLENLLRSFIDSVETRVTQFNDCSEEEQLTRFNTDFESFETLGSQHKSNLNSLQTCINPPHMDTVPYAQHCPIYAELRFDTYKDWELRSIELLQNGVLVNKPELAKTKALLEENQSQADIADILNKSPSTVSRQTSQIEDLEERSRWTLENHMDI